MTFFKKPDPEVDREIIGLKNSLAVKKKDLSRKQRKVKRAIEGFYPSETDTAWFWWFVLGLLIGIFLQ